MRSISDGFTLCCSFDISLMARLDASFPPLYPPTPSATEKIYPPSSFLGSRMLSWLMVSKLLGKENYEHE